MSSSSKIHVSDFSVIKHDGGSSERCIYFYNGSGPKKYESHSKIRKGNHFPILIWGMDDINMIDKMRIMGRTITVGDGITFEYKNEIKDYLKDVWEKVESYKTIGEEASKHNGIPDDFINEKGSHRLVISELSTLYFKKGSDKYSVESSASMFNVLQRAMESRGGKKIERNDVIRWIIERMIDKSYNGEPDIVVVFGHILREALGDEEVIKFSKGEDKVLVIDKTGIFSGILGDVESSRIEFRETKEYPKVEFPEE